MSDWVNLGNATPVDAWAVNMMVAVSHDGVSRVVLLTLQSAEDDTMWNVCIDPDGALRLGWEMIGVSTELIEEAHGSPLASIDGQQDTIRASIIDSLRDIDDDD